jgi:hypothetical protein
MPCGKATVKPDTDAMLANTRRRSAERWRQGLTSGSATPGQLGRVVLHAVSNLGARNAAAAAHAHRPCAALPPPLPACRRRARSSMHHACVEPAPTLDPAAEAAGPCRAAAPKAAAPSRVATPLGCHHRCRKLVDEPCRPSPAAARHLHGRRLFVAGGSGRSWRMEEELVGGHGCRRRCEQQQVREDEAIPR